MDRVFFTRFFRYMDEIARLGSIRQASEVLNVSASAVDKQLLKAELDLGLKLFERHPRGVRLTSAGELILYRMRGWQKDLQTVSAEIEELKGLRRGEVRIAVPQETVTSFLPQVLSSFLREHPKINTTVKVVDSEQVRQMVIDGDMDLGLTFSPRPLPGVLILRELSFKIFALMPDTNVQRKSVTLDQFFSRPILMPDGTSHLRDILDIAAARAGVDFQQALTANNLELLRQLVREGVGHSAVLTCANAFSGAGEGLTTLPIRGAGISDLELSLIAPRDRATGLAGLLATRHFESFIDTLSV
ncbi:LysR family transcriptional regulator [Pacificibacter marinus]|uniref:LysR family transcriptional regulator n=1 Tax=Pacificibacter marinus TaxID=658057 RepID=UPI001C07B52F|nr:LysR family transcriptional regulator [Pacificibacter marinus]MBU2867625.1 LysR family transcriptional regulator [Pacificibacter marinus]